MTIKFILDTREKALQSYFVKNSIPFEIRQLDLGDVLIMYSKGEIIDEPISESAKKLLKSNEKLENFPVYTIVIERKSYTDLKLSMADGRYHEQKSRYMKLLKGTCYYILENNDPEFKELGKKQFLGTYIHTIVRDGLGVLLTNGIHETYEYLIKIGETLEKFGFNDEEKVSTLENTQIKKKKSTGKDVYKQQLCCFPGISSGKADLILSVYPEMKSLVMAIEQGTFKVKGIGNVLMNNIKEGLFFRSKTSDNKIIIEFE